MKIIEKPGLSEFAPQAAAYIALLPDDDLVLKHLRDNFEQVREFVLSLPAEKLLYRYAAGKWTIKEILVHLIDDERIYCYRALRFARNDQTELSGFEQDDYTIHAGANDRSLANIFEEYESVRRATISFFEGLGPAALLRSGLADGNRMSVRGLVYHIAGHELHHLNVIRQNYL